MILEMEAAFFGVKIELEVVERLLRSQDNKEEELMVDAHRVK